MATGGTVPYIGTGNYFISSSSVFSISVSDQNGCNTDTSINIHLINDSIAFTANNSTACPHANLAFSVANDILDPIWNPGGFSGHTYNINNLLTDTLVTMTGISPDGCMTTQTFNISMEDCMFSPSISNDVFNVSIYPSPASVFFTLEVSGNNQYSAMMIDATGRSVKELLRNQKAGPYYITMEEIASGIYYVVITDTISGNAIAKKLIID
jgi:hypothetical protein